MTCSQLLRKPSAYAPVLMSLLALAVIGVALLTRTAAAIAPSGRPDEGAAAHLFQLLIIAQLPIVIAFLARWGWSNRAGALGVVATQAVAAALALAPVAALHL